MGDVVTRSFGTLWAPGFSGWAMPLVWAAVCVVLVFGILSSCWTTASSAADEGEHNLFKQPRRGMLVWDYFLSAIGWSVPALLCIGVLLTIFPLGYASTLVLVSRERSTEFVGNDGGRAEADWKKLALADAGSLQIVDVGPIVDDILKRTIEEVDGGFLPDDVVLRTKLAQFCVEAVRSRRLADLVIAEAEIDKLSSGPTVLPTPNLLPSWLVESVELGVLRLVAERTRVKRVAVLTSGQLDHTGLPTWRFAESYIKQAGGYAGQLDNIGVVSPSSSAVVPVLVSAVHLESPSARPRIAATFTVPPSATGGPFNVELSIDSPNSPKLSPQQLRPGLTRTLQVRVVELPVAPIASANQVLYASVNQSRSSTAIRGGRTRWSREVVIQTPNAKWNQSVLRLTNKSVDPWFESVRQRLFAPDGLLQDVTVKLSVAPQDGDIVIDGTISNRGLLVYLHKAGRQPPSIPLLDSAAPASGDYLPWNSRRPIDPHYVVNTLSLPAALLSTPTSGTFETELYATPVSAVKSPLNHGLPVRRVGRDPSIVAVLSDQRPGEGNDLAASGQSTLWIGVGVEGSNLLADPSFNSTLRAAAFWSTVLLSSQRVLDPPVSPPSQKADTGNRMIFILNGSHIADTAASAYAWGSRVLIAGCVAAVIWGLLQRTGRWWSRKQETRG